MLEADYPPRWVIIACRSTIYDKYNNKGSSALKDKALKEYGLRYYIDSNLKSTEF